MSLMIEIGKTIAVDVFLAARLMNDRCLIQRSIFLFLFCFVFHSARGGTRTHMGLLPHHFK